MNITQTFYDGLAASYDQLFENWSAATGEQAALLDGLFHRYGFDRTARVLDCACGIGTQAIGLAGLGYAVTGSDISEGELAEAGRRAAAAGVALPLHRADFRRLAEAFAQPFDILIAMDNALPHMLTRQDLAAAAGSIAGQLKAGGIFVGSIRDYDALLEQKPPYSPPYIHKTGAGQRVSFQTWQWSGDVYTLTQYIINDGEQLDVSRFTCQYRATRRQELTDLFTACGCQVDWLMPETTGFYQPILVAKKQ